MRRVSYSQYLGVQVHSRVQPWGVVADGGGAVGYLTPQSGIADWIHSLLGVNV